MSNPVVQRPIVYCGNCRAAQTNKVTQKMECWFDQPEVAVFEDKKEVSGYKVVSFRPEVQANEFCLRGQQRVDSELVK